MVTAQTELQMDKENEEQEKEVELFPTEQPFEENVDEIKEASDEEGDKSSDEDKGEEGEKKVDFEKRFNDSQLFIEELRTKNTEQEDSILDLTGRLKHLEEVTKKNQEVINPDEEYKEYKAPEKPDVASDWANKVETEEKALVTVFPDYYEVVGKSGDTDSPFLKAVAEDPKLHDRILNADRPAAEAYRVGLDYKLAQVKKKDPVPPKPKTPSLRDAPGSNNEPMQKPEDSLGSIFKN